MNEWMQECNNECMNCIAIRTQFIAERETLKNLFIFWSDKILNIVVTILYGRFFNYNYLISLVLFIIQCLRDIVVMLKRGDFNTEDNDWPE